MSNREPDRDSQRTLTRATALAWSRGCDDGNPCWDDCLETAVDDVVDGHLDSWARQQATTSTYWHYTHP